jgi:glc operon protein GlcG
VKRIIGICVVAIFALAAFHSQVFAQLADKKALTLAEAKKLVAAAEAAATKGTAHMSFAVLDDGGHLLAFERMDGASLVTGKFAQAKAMASVMYKAPTDGFSDALGKGRTAILALPDAVPFGGGLPLKMGDQVVGAIGCSGGNTPTQDTEVCTAAAETLRK